MDDLPVARHRANAPFRVNGNGTVTDLVTGLRLRPSLEAVSATIGGQRADVLYAGPQPASAGLDQLTLRIPRTLVGRGEVPLVLSVDGHIANTVTVNIR